MVCCALKKIDLIEVFCFHERIVLDSLRGSSVKIGTIQRRLAWPLRKDDTHKSRSVNISFAAVLHGRRSFLRNLREISPGARDLPRLFSAKCAKSRRSRVACKPHWTGTCVAPRSCSRRSRLRGRMRRAARCESSIAGAAVA